MKVSIIIRLFVKYIKILFVAKSREGDAHELPCTPPDAHVSKDNSILIQLILTLI